MLIPRFLWLNEFPHHVQYHLRYVIFHDFIKNTPPLPRTIRLGLISHVAQQDRRDDRVSLSGLQLEGRRELGLDRVLGCGYMSVFTGVTW